MTIPTVTLENGSDNFSFPFVMERPPMKTETYLPPAFFPRPLSQLPTGLLSSSPTRSSYPVRSSSLKARTGRSFGRSSSARGRLERYNTIPLTLTVKAPKNVDGSGFPAEEEEELQDNSLGLSVESSPTIKARSITSSPPPLPPKDEEEWSLVEGETMRPLGILPPIRKNTAPAILITNHSREPFRGTNTPGVSFANDIRHHPRKANTMWSPASRTNWETLWPGRNTSMYPDLLNASPRYGHSTLHRIQEDATARSPRSPTGSHSTVGRLDTNRWEEFKIRVKIHCEDEVRGMGLTPEVPYQEFLDRLRDKFGTKMEGKMIKFIDEDDLKVSLCDSDDYELAIDSVRSKCSYTLKCGQLVLWLE
ncbi:hypothetical protein FRC15_000491 [Serendipita sp. 397]|nr:hypothetical protein FRC15_000491 [Serendipita sp. 397]